MRILLVVDPNRRDFYQYLNCDSSVQYFLLWKEKQDGEPNLDNPDFFQKEFFWREFSTPNALIDTIQPDKIVFFEIIDLRQIALLVACKARKIPTIYLEHGAAGGSSDLLKRWEHADSQALNIKRIWTRLSGGLGNVIAAKLFYYSVTKGFKSFASFTKYISLPFKFLSHIPNVVLAKSQFPERVPDILITFSRPNFDVTREYTGALVEQGRFTGIPFFDKYYSAKFTEKDHVVFIDHPNLEDQLYDWTPDFHRNLAENLNEFAKDKNQKVYVKLHPKSDKSRWLAYGFDPNLVEILQEEECTQLYLESKLILGYSSSLLTAFLCAHKNVVLLGWHPEPRVLGYDFSKTGLCHSSLYFDDLGGKFDYWTKHNLSFDKEKYAQFITESNPDFDGHATDRVINLITRTISS